MLLLHSLIEHNPKIINLMEFHFCYFQNLRILYFWYVYFN